MNKDCRFCEIIGGDRNAEEIVFENNEFIVVSDRNRKTSSGGICLIIPKQHVPNILELTEQDGNGLIKIQSLVGKAMERAFKCNGIRIWTAVNKAAGQSIFHCHIHLVPCNSIMDRIIASYSGLYDLKKRIFGKRKLSEKVNFELAEKIRAEIKASR
ncbi:HIT family protein [Maribacter sp. IgM3_T14_3]|uniref:HIT family protein n=1 Tax=Maribacter sp. IgM3_T14_3 TaxID=3415140 RepID=UPI003C6EC842